MSKGNKILSIQYLRGIAALGVVLCHYGSGLTTYPRLSKILNLGQVGVFIFFMISGFIIIHSLQANNYRVNKFFVFLAKRSIRIDPLYYIVIILTLLLFKILSYMPTFKGKDIDFLPWQFLSHLFYIVPFTKYQFYNHVFWTLCVEFQFYLIIGIFYFLYDHHIYKKIFLIIFALSSFISMPNSYYLVFNFAVVFAAGISILDLYRTKKWTNIILPIFMFGLIFYKFGFFIFLILLISVTIIMFLKVISKQLMLLGDISYSLYLTHGLVLIVLLGILKAIKININSNPLLWLFFEIFISIVVAYVFYKLIEQPSLRLSKRVFYKKD